jgi:hypothetical protein
MSAVVARKARCLCYKVSSEGYLCNSHGGAMANNVGGARPNDGDVAAVGTGADDTCFSMRVEASKAACYHGAGALQDGLDVAGVAAVSRSFGGFKYSSFNMNFSSLTPICRNGGPGPQIRHQEKDSPCDGSLSSHSSRSTTTTTANPSLPTTAASAAAPVRPAYIATIATVTHSPSTSTIAKAPTTSILHRR